MAGLTLYTNPMSRGRIARWMVEEVGADYDVEMLGYGGTMKADAYLAINPMGKVPAIVHDGHVVTECAAICAYLADAFPDAGLAPVAGEHADYYRWLFFAAGPVEQAVTNRSLGVVPTDDQQRMVGYGDYDRVVDVLEAAVSAHPYIAGDRFTAADVYVGSQVMWGTQFGTLPKRDAFLAYAARLADRPAHVRASELDDAAMAEMQAAG
ncbi:MULTISPECIES: glutathione S-transferase family protein [Sphingomonas]|jgi:glutathione S-transferase|uniref:Glutathione S-transferase n=1 Tax=Sphingomonas hankookensis TaxID=563996 RepID=A0ABR5YE73_9SPHN|nr:MULTISPECIES: glutathione S-transferase family protein [Sphingomonas]KZE15822.1 glutathione S-transferase [Sphingomonas hankookensis]PZT93080.1 MAG: glutathione S-transferase family protein [Sphingomonas sp.]RSV32840.1 glutathione S-transferase family protein [Sphingomonas sp. ABOLH]WCP73319.1 glutathione S-transferase family protein [Sphingomonas hankookensis]